MIMTNIVLNDRVNLFLCGVIAGQLLIWGAMSFSKWWGQR